MELFKKGDHVLYVPRHARGSCDHPDCQKGVVSSVNDKYQGMGACFSENLSGKMSMRKTEMEMTMKDERGKA